ncbi:aminotransferase class I/II-fold pyridoxal phosphate-dependent enzyme [Asaia bogorensis]|uniref:8-amino-7-oxononanoate synthase n=1 Tax=Asaia bogorensis NBRC 16594 TaxID=1231624 RepID=A0AAN4R150_9PROT|nr:8-amino-7-oxononanoate synthase [Asaia bogorensis]BAT18544.1 alpha-oxoamine synthase/8-amino-7-oxononanoate synthase [Asaia bogorensis NBRC 16594]GBQ75109.1 8-amino-7-oxononanoate synthase [Asaia bogorensis NBRC 16594]GEL52896.1 putative 8-amino-7-oxononanoate synthase [Asaia bogorensis NBRC 16594]
MTRFDPLLRQALDTLESRSLRRTLRPLHRTPDAVLRQGREVLDFSSNDYLGLSGHPLLRDRAADWAVQHGTGARASRLVSGTLDLHQQVEGRLAHFKGAEAALLFASGWQANAAVLPALFRLAREQTGMAPLVFADKLNHASMHHGCAAAGVKQIRFRHNDLAHLEALIERHAEQPGMRFIVTESVFSMDGDTADIAALSALAKRYNAFFYLDEAHATGVLGPQGRGLSHGHEVDLVMGTFSKALGSMGAYIAGSRALCDWIITACSGFIYSTAPSPPMLGAMDAALELMPDLEAARLRLRQNAGLLRQRLNEAGIETGGSTTQIIPVMIGDEEATLALAETLEKQGLLTIAIRPPTVPAGSARLRLALSASHDGAAINRLADALTGVLRPGRS